MVQLLFFDTFSHEVTDAQKLDLVQFPKAVLISEVRVIPLGARVQADFPGGVRLGATNPSRFEIDFFVNDLGKRHAATFENVGQLKYNQQGPIKLDFENTPPTDGLLLRGCYDTITLAVYGCISKVNREPQPTPPPPPPAPLSPPPLQVPTQGSRGREHNNSGGIAVAAPPPPSGATHASPHALTSPRHPSAAAAAAIKRDGVVLNPPTLPHPLPEKVNPNERIRDWLQDTQIPHSPLDLDQSPAKVWDDPPYDSDPVAVHCKDGISPRIHSRDISIHRSPPRSPPHSPLPSPHSPPPSPTPHSPPPSPQRPLKTVSLVRSRERSQRSSQDVSTRDRPDDRHHERVHEKSHERSHERSYERSHDRSQERSHDRSHERSHERSRERSDHDGDRSKGSREKLRHRSRERSRERSEHRSGSVARSGNADLWEKDYKVSGDGGGEHYPREGGGGSNKEKKRSRENRKTREEKKDKRRSLEEWDDGEMTAAASAPTRRQCHRRSYSSDSAHEGGPRTPPMPLPTPPPHSSSSRTGGRGWRDDDQQASAGGIDGRAIIDEQQNSVRTLPNEQGNDDADEDSPTKRQRLDAAADEADETSGREVTPAKHVVAADDVLLFGDEMEAISDDEDLPDLPPEGESTVTLNETPKTGGMTEDAAPTAADAAPSATTTVAATGGVAAVPPANEFDFEFEEIMSDEEELPEYQECEEDAGEEEYIVEEWEDWLKPYSLLQEFQCVAPLVQLSSPALTQHQTTVVANTATADKMSEKLLSVVEGCSVPSFTSSDDEREAFVHSCEAVTQLLHTSLRYLQHNKLRECISLLCGWLEVGLDMDEAVAQPQPVYKIRHLRAGLRLCIAMCHCNDDVTRHMLSQVPLFHLLHSLYQQAHMALSIKLLILRTLDSVLCCSAGVQQFLSVQPRLGLTGYELVLQMLAETTHSRAKVSAAAILRKLHLLEVLEKLRDDVTTLQSLLPPPPHMLHMGDGSGEDPVLGCEEAKGVLGEDAVAVDDVEGVAAASMDTQEATAAGPTEDSEAATTEWCDDGEGVDEQMELGADPVVVVEEGEGEDDVPVGDVEEEEVDDDDDVRDGGGGGIVVPRQLVTSITSCLQQTLHTFRHAEQLLAQPHRYLPVGKQFQVPRCPYDLMQEVFVLLDHGCLITSLAQLLNCLSYGLLVAPLDTESPLSSRCPPMSTVYNLLVKLLQGLTDSPKGLTYLAAHHIEATNVLRSLLKGSGGGRMNRLFSCSNVFGDEISNDLLGDTFIDLQEFGSQLLERLHVLQQLDSLAAISESPGPLDIQQSVVHLNTLTGMLLTQQSKLSLARTLATGDYMKLIMPFLAILQPNDSADNAPVKVACFGYAVELLTVAVKLDGNINFLERHAENICQLIEAEGTREGPPLDESVKLAELIPWLSVARKSECYTYDNIPLLVDVVKDQLEHIDKFPGELFTVLRILKSMAIPPYPATSEEGEDNDGVIQELKYKYAVVQLFYADLTTHLNTLLTRVCNLLPQPGLHTGQLSGTEGSYLVNLLHPTLSLLYCLLQQVIVARNATYHDLSSVQPLLSVYLLLSAYPASCPHGAAAFLLQQKVLQSLLLYTVPGHSADTPCNVNSLWTQMIAQILKFCENSPHTMVTGLCLLTELLPLPLPIVGRQLKAEEQERCIMVRKLWAANLAPLAENLYKLLHHLAPASQPSLTHTLRRLCVAMADLAPQLVVMMMRPLLDLALQYQRADSASTATNSIVNTSASNSMSRILYMLASLSSHPGCKAAILHLFTTEPYNVLLPNWCSSITQSLEGEDKATKILRQHHAPLTLLLHHLCHVHNNMQGKIDTGLWGVPVRELLAPMVDCLVVMLSYPSIEHRLLHHILNTLNNVITHDYGLYHLKSVLDKRKGCLRGLLERLAKDITTEIKSDSQDPRPTLQSMLELCHGLLSCDAVPRLVITSINPAEQATGTVAGMPPSSSPPMLFLRTMTVTPTELCAYVAWDSGADLIVNATSADEEKSKREKGGDSALSDGKSKAENVVTTSQEEKTTEAVTTSLATGDPTATTVNSSGSSTAVSMVTTTASSSAVAPSLSSSITTKVSESVVAATTKEDAAQSEPMDTGDQSKVAQHPLRMLEQNVVNINCCELVTELLYSDVNELIAVLEAATAAAAAGDANKVSEVSEVSGAGCCGLGGGSITQQYDERLISCAPGPLDEHPALWLQSPPTQYSSGPILPVSDASNTAAGAQDSGPDMVAVSLCQLLRECSAGDYDLGSNVQKLLRGHQAGGSPQKATPLTKGPAKFKSNPMPLRPGFANRGMNLRTDPFRCRPPNTSRPPSLHVDDFVALESTGHQPTGPTGYNRISFGRGKMLLDSMRGRGGRGMMNRGDGRGGPMPGRFMYRPPMYRPDFNNRGMMNRGMRWNFRGGDGSGMMRGGPMGMNGGQYRPQGPGPMGMRFMRGRGMFNRGSPAGYGDRGARHMRGNFH
uniref:Protein virilizer-like n=2 Tax=Hirondellea gigas TaxID=1518452 RepID=A0A6A7FSB1_9CRUS